jgi:integrase
LAGENHRERVLTQAEEAKYLAAASEPLASIATVLLDTALRPEECYRLEWPHLRLYGDRPALRVMQGKTSAARRIVPLLPRARAVLEMLWENAGRPREGFVFPAPTKQGHVWHDSIRVQHRNALNLSKVLVGETRLTPGTLFTSGILGEGNRRIPTSPMTDGPKAVFCEFYMPD